MSDPALAALLARRASFLAYVERRVGDRALAEDLLQTAYMRAVASANRPVDENAAGAWFYAVLRHSVIDFYRRRATEARVFDTEALDAGLDAAAPAAPEKFVCGCVQHVLPGMKPAYAELIREVELEESSLADFAARHAITAGNAAVRAHRARAALRRALMAFCGSCSMKSCLECLCPAPAGPEAVPAAGSLRA